MSYAQQMIRTTPNLAVAGDALVACIEACYECAQACSPKLNGRVERLIGTVRREFWECTTSEFDLPMLQQALRDYEIEHNMIRPHPALGYDSPQEHLNPTSSHVSNQDTP